MPKEYRVNGNDRIDANDNLLRKHLVHWNTTLYTESIDTTFFIAPFRCKVESIAVGWRVQESGGTLTGILRRCQGVEAPASGDALNTAVNMVSTAETVATPAVITTSNVHILEPGDRLAWDFTDDVAGELAGVYSTVVISELA